MPFSYFYIYFIFYNIQNGVVALNSGLTKDGREFLLESDARRGWAFYGWLWNTDSLVLWCFINRPEFGVNLVTSQRQLSC